MIAADCVHCHHLCSEHHGDGCHHYGCECTVDLVHHEFEAQRAMDARLLVLVRGLTVKQAYEVAYQGCLRTATGGCF